MSTWLTITIIATVMAVLGALAAYIWLRRDSIVQTFEQRVSQALKWWKVIDKRLEQTRATTLLWLMRELDDLLQYPDDLLDETRDRLANLSTRLRRIKTKKSGPQGFFR